MLIGRTMGWSLLMLACAGGCTLANAANAACDDQMRNSLQQCERIVGSLRYDKLTQMRVFASDGAVYTAGQAHIMQVDLRMVAEECAHGDTAAAARDLAEVREILKEHGSLS